MGLHVVLLILIVTRTAGRVGIKEVLYNTTVHLAL